MNDLDDEWEDVGFSPDPYPDEVSLRAERNFEHPDAWVSPSVLPAAGPWQIHWVSDLPLGPMLCEPAMLLDHGSYGVHPFYATYMPASAFLKETP